METVSIERAQALLDEICEALPPAFFERLNGGICLLPNVKFNPMGRANELYILGEYVHDHAMGRYINIYYGSILQIYGRAGEDVIRRQLEEVLLHEFTHHLESMAGERGLELKDREQMRRYLARK